jgi:hypothetical protein
MRPGASRHTDARLGPEAVTDKELLGESREAEDVGNKASAMLTPSAPGSARARCPR